MVGVSAVAVDAEPVERRDAHRDREIAVRSAARERCACERKPDLVRNPGGLVEDDINAPVARESRAGDLAGYRRFDIRPHGFERQDLRLHLVGTRAVAEAQVDLDHAILGNRIAGGAAIDQPDIGCDSARAVVETLDREHQLRHGRDRAAPLVRVGTCMRRPAVRADDEDADALARRYDLAAVTRRLGDEDVAMAARLPLNEAARRGAAQFLVRGEQERDRQRRAPPRPRNPPVCRDRDRESALHVVDAGPVDPVALAAPGELAGKRADRMHGIHVAQHQDARLVACRIAAHAQDVAKRTDCWLPFAYGPGAFEELHDRVEHRLTPSTLREGLSISTMLWISSRMASLSTRSCRKDDMSAWYLLRNGAQE